jgi:hypothetical protein
MRALAILIVVLAAAAAHAQPGQTEATAPAVPAVQPVPAAPPAPPVPADPQRALRDANAAAAAGDWPRVAALVAPGLADPRALAPADLAEAHRLAGLAAFFAGQRDDAERELVAYLRIDLDGHLDPALYPPEVVSFFDDVRARHAAELRALRPQPRHLIFALLPPVAQFKNGEPVKGYVIGGLLVATLATDLTTYFVLRSWCAPLLGGRVECDQTTDHDHSATALEAINVAAGVGFFVTLAYGMYDGVRGYRRRTHELELAPYATSRNGVSSLGVVGNF